MPARIRGAGGRRQASAYTERAPETPEGRRLIADLRADAAGRKVGLRSIVAVLAQALDVQLRIGREQTTARHPANYRGGSWHLVRSRSGSMQLNLHELGHALAQLLDARVPGWSRGLESRLAALAGPGTFASAPTPAEGFAEWVRASVTDPQSLPNDLTNRLMALLDRELPGAGQALRDAHRAYVVNQGRSYEARMRSYAADRPSGRGLLEGARDLVDGFLFRAVNAEHALRASILRPLGRILRSAGGRLDRRLQAEIADTPADVLRAYQSTLHAPQEAQRALYGWDVPATGRLSASA